MATTVAAAPTAVLPLSHSRGSRVAMYTRSAPKGSTFTTRAIGLLRAGNCLQGKSNPNGGHSQWGVCSRACGLSRVETLDTAVLIYFCFYFLYFIRGAKGRGL